MAIDFTLTPQKREFQIESRSFASDVLAGATDAESLPTPEERFLATKPAYEAMVAGRDFCESAFPSRRAARTPVWSTWPSWLRNSTA